MRISGPLSLQSREPAPNQFKIYRQKNGLIPFWDDPTVYGGIVRPENYQYNDDILEILSNFYRGRYTEDDLIILSVLRDCFVASESQLRRLLKSKISSKTISDRLRYMARDGVVDMWKFRSRDNEDYKPPAVWSIGVGGYFFLKHQSHEFVLNPKHLIDSGPKTIQRYVAINEIRTQLYQYRALRKWRWHGVVDGNPLLGKPFATGYVQLKNMYISLAIERLQQSQPFVSFASKRLTRWNQVYKEKKHLPLLDIPVAPTVVVMSVATAEMAYKCAEKIPFSEYELPVWFIVDEYLEDPKRELPQSVLVWDQGDFKELTLTMLTKRDHQNDREGP
jgi:DNA-binding HxlR family transcriptional regulator